MRLRISSSILLCVLTAPAFANHHVKVESIPVSAPVTASISTPSKFYVGIFGGGGSSNKFNVSQYGTAFFTEAEGGPLSVNAFGRTQSESASFFGAQFGYQAQEILLNASTWTLSPAVELEGYSMNDSTFNGSLVNNSLRLAEGNFSTSYPMSRTVFLANGVLGFNNPCWLVHPYIGLGIGSALERISGASSAQVSPPEVGVNHYNANPNASDSTFAGQVKLGLSYDVNKYFSIFADYRWLYLASSSFVFGSTIFPGHVETSSWQVNMDAQRYNMVNAGVRFSL